MVEGLAAVGASVVSSRKQEPCDEVAQAVAASTLTRGRARMRLR